MISLMIKSSLYLYSTVGANTHLTDFQYPKINSAKFASSLSPSFFRKR